MTKTPDIDNRTLFIQGLRDLASFYDAHPQVPPPYQHQVMVFTDDKATLAAIAKAGNWEKVWSDSWFSLKKAFGESLLLEIYVDRSVVCRKVVTGTRVVPATPATEEREEEVTEWVCDDVSLLGDPRRI